jgi:excisionase family DNA binding protein
MDTGKRSTTRRLYGYGEAAEQLSISRRMVERLVAERALRVVRLGRRRLIDAEDLSRFIQKAKGS